MGEVPLIHTRMKRDIRRFDKNRGDFLSGATAIAVIARQHAQRRRNGRTGRGSKVVSVLHRMRDAAAAMNRPRTKIELDAATEAMAAFQKSCDDCHAVFHKGRRDRMTHLPALFSDGENGQGSRLNSQPGNGHDWAFDWERRTRDRPRPWILNLAQKWSVDSGGARGVAALFAPVTPRLQERQRFVSRRFRPKAAHAGGPAAGCLCRQDCSPR